MSRRHLLSWPRLVIALGAVVALTTTVLSPGFGRSSHLRLPMDELDPNKPECPHSYDTIRKAPSYKQGKAIIVTDPVVLGPNGTSVGGLRTNIPEFNDCQRILFKGQYGPLMSIFASYRLDSLKLGPKGEPVKAGTRVLAAAEILNYSTDFEYPALGIMPYFNCLYLYGAEDQIRARMIPVGGEEKKCGEGIDPVTDPRGIELAVVATQAGYFNKPGDYPPVARWDWDDERKVQYIGIRCGPRWCEVGPGDKSKPPQRRFTPSTPYFSPPANSNASPSGIDRVRAIKGWYDQQYLAIPVAGDGAAGESAPTRLKATVFPHPELSRSRNPDAFKKRWVPVAYVALDPIPDPGGAVLKYYKAKFNFEPVVAGSPLNKMNQLSLCLGTVADCHIPTTLSKSLLTSCGQAGYASANAAAKWWMMVTSPSNDVMYRCATFRDHAGIRIPGTARWRWLADDETTWDLCATGCCEMNGNKY